MHAMIIGILCHAEAMFCSQVEGVQPMVTIEDCVEAEEIVKADEGIRTLLRERYGITDMAMVAADPWFYGDRFGEHSLVTLCLSSIICIS